MSRLKEFKVEELEQRLEMRKWKEYNDPQVLIDDLQALDSTGKFD